MQEAQPGVAKVFPVQVVHVLGQLLVGAHDDASQAVIGAHAQRSMSLIACVCVMHTQVSGAHFIVRLQDDGCVPAQLEHVPQLEQLLERPDWPAGQDTQPAQLPASVDGESSRSV